jgi:hypothetical protein
VTDSEGDVADEVGELCRRVLGAGATAEAAAGRALDGGFDGDRLGALRRAVRECRREGEVEVAAVPAPGDAGLREAVAAELSAAVCGLPERQREVLALRERFGLEYDEIAGVMGIEVAAVAALLARARLGLRAELRDGGAAAANDACAERERALPALARRQDRQPVEPADAGWIRDHMEACGACERAHAMMLEASACYRGWSSA